MITNEERREVAKRLRQEANTNNWQDLVILDYPIARALKEKVTYTGDDLFEKRLLLKLADLIEPEPERTCKRRNHDTDNYYMRCCSCSECNAGWFEDINDKPFEYCPNCGAKVIK